MRLWSLIRNQEVLLVFTYAPAGLGHLRVTDALFDGVPGESSGLILGSHDKSIGWIHRMMSSYVPLRVLMETFQQGSLEDVYCFFYRLYLREASQVVREQMKTILDQSLEKPKVVLIVATHFGLAHQLAAIKKELEKEEKTRIILVVQVTDDSPQRIWYVPGADITMVPSEKTKLELEKVGVEDHLEKIPIVVQPYPISPQMTARLTPGKYKLRQEQLKFGGKEKVEVAVPVSGAAVGLEYLMELMDEVAAFSDRFVFNVIAKYAPYTKPYIHRMLERPYEDLILADKDREAVSRYEQLYQEKVVGLEITKPSEQAFKVLTTPDRVGGVVMLFSKPVGRQEYDNLDFMRRHKLIPSAVEQNKMEKMTRAEDWLEGSKLEKWRKKARNWRGLCLPWKSGKEGALFIRWALKNGLLYEMCAEREVGKDEAVRRGYEVGDYGVKKFWELMDQLVAERMV